MKVSSPFIRAVAARLHTKFGLALAGTCLVASLALAQSVAPALGVRPLSLANLARLPAVESAEAQRVAYNEDAPLPEAIVAPNDSAAHTPSSAPTAQRIPAEEVAFTRIPQPVAPPVTQSLDAPLPDTDFALPPTNPESVNEAPLPDASLSIPTAAANPPPLAPLGPIALPPVQFETTTADENNFAPLPGEPLALADDAPPAADQPQALPRVEEAPPMPALAGEEPTTSADKIGVEPVNNSLEFLRSATVLVEPGQWEFDYGLEYVWQNNPGLVELDTDGNNVPDAIGIGRFRNRQLFVPLAARYGWSENLQFFANLPVGGALFERSDVVSNDFNSVGGLGDLRVGANYLWREHGPCSPDIVLNFDITAPTGADQFDRGPFQAFLGDGFWAAGANITFIQSIDPVVLFGSLGYQHVFGEEHVGLFIERGDRFSLAFGVGWAVNDSVTFSTTFQSTLEASTLVDDVAIPNSSLEPMTLRLAVTAFVSECKIIEPFVRFGLNEDAPQVDTGLIITRKY